MKIKSVHLEQFKRFTDLTITNIPETAKFVILLGPNGCGKSSLFDSFKVWHTLRGYSSGSDDEYCKKDLSEKRQCHELVNVEFYKDIANYSKESIKSSFYFRTAYRNTARISVNSLSKVNSPIEQPDYKKMIENDSTIDDNYQRLISRTIALLYDESNDEKRVCELREEILNKIRIPLSHLFPDLSLTEIGLVTDKAEFYFKKGAVEKYGYEKLSGGEKAAFDLILDIVIKSEYYDDSIICIDEPETHIHTSLQSKLLEELYHLIPNQSQLWIATHSFGMLKEARRLKEVHPNEIVFLNFDGYDFDEKVILEPTDCDVTLWNKMLEITLDNYASFLSPETIVFCEGTTRGRKRKDFDARCYANIFSRIFPSAVFYSLGSCENIENSQYIIDFIQNISPTSNIIRVIDRDDRSEEEILDLEQQGIHVLSRRHCECYLLDDEVLKKWCESNGRSSEIDKMLQIKKEKMDASISRGNPIDDVKSAANDICTAGKKMLGVTACGNNGEMIMRDTLSKLITPDMEVFVQLKKDIFGE